VKFLQSIKWPIFFFFPLPFSTYCISVIMPAEIPQAQKEELAVTYAALILHDEGLPITVRRVYRSFTRCLNLSQSRSWIIQESHIIHISLHSFIFPTISFEPLLSFIIRSSGRQVERCSQRCFRQGSTILAFSFRQGFG
jgi:hypothetical protein